MTFLLIRAYFFWRQGLCTHFYHIRTWIAFVPWSIAYKRYLWGFRVSPKDGTGIREEIRLRISPKVSATESRILLLPTHDMFTQDKTGACSCMDTRELFTQKTAAACISSKFSDHRWRNVGDAQISFWFITQHIRWCEESMPWPSYDSLQDPQRISKSLRASWEILFVRKKGKNAYFTCYTHMIQKREFWARSSDIWRRHSSFELSIVAKNWDINDAFVFRLRKRSKYIHNEKPMILDAGNSCK